jgi:predicted deacylase
MFELGQRVATGDVIATVGDAFGSSRRAMKSPIDGWVIARTQNPLVSQGDALVHIAADDQVGVDEPVELGATPPR